MKKHILLPIALLLLASTYVHAQKIAVTLAGISAPGFSGDNGSSRAAAISGIKDVCMDAAQNIYFSDTGNYRIRKIAAATGVITTIAGGGTSLAENIPATNAAIKPNYICTDGNGYLYMTTGNQVRKVKLSTGTISTVAGSTWGGLGGDGGPAAAALLNQPLGIAADSAGNLFIADRANNCIRKIAAATGIITTLAGGATPGYTGDSGPATASRLNNPVNVCLSPAGDVYCSDQDLGYPVTFNYSVIRKISAAAGIITTVAGTAISAGFDLFGVPATSAVLGTVTGICCAKNGDLYINEMSCSCRRLNMATDTLEELCGNFSFEGFTDDTDALGADMSFPMGLCLDNAGNLYIADNGNARIRKLVQTGHTPVFAFGDGQYIDPVAGAAVTLDSLLWITDIDIAQTETWTVITPPAHGSLTGFPASQLSNGVFSTVKPAGLWYTALPSYTGTDQFKVRVSDGVLADTITVYVGPKSVAPPVPSLVGTVANAGITSLYPNPASAVLNIQWANLPPGDNNATITDITGREVYHTILPTNMQSGNMQVDIAAIPAGVYFVKVDGSEVNRFVKK